MTIEAGTPDVEADAAELRDDVSFTLAMEGEDADLMAVSAIEADGEFDVDISEESDMTDAEMAQAAEDVMEDVIEDAIAASAGDIDEDVGEDIDAAAAEAGEAEDSSGALDGSLAGDEVADQADAGDADAAGTADAARAPLAFAVDTDATAEQVRMLECLLFAASEPLDISTLAARLPAEADVPALLEMLQAQMQGRGVELVKVANGWRLQTPVDLAWLLEDVREERRKLSGAARETLAIIAYHQPVTRAEIEDIRGVAVSKGTVDMLMELGWVRMRGRRRAPGRPVTYGTTDLFLSHFGLEALTDLPGKAELKAAGLLDNRLPADFTVPEPGLFDTSNEDPLEDTPLETAEFHVDFMEDAGEDEAPVQAQAS